MEKEPYSQTAAPLTGIANTKKGKKLRILKARGAFLFLPVYSSSDIVHGSWWWFWGSLFSIFMGVVPLIDVNKPIFHVSEHTALKAFGQSLTWALVIVTSFFYTLGSYAFIRAFEDPAPPPIFKNTKHLATDELLGAWLCFLASLPTVPYVLIYLYSEPTVLEYWAMLFFSFAFIGVSGWLVYVCYPKNHHILEEAAPRILPIVQKYFGHNSWLCRHVENDWLASCWFFFWGFAIATLGCYIFILGASNDRQLFVWITGYFDCLMFWLGSAYLCAGSYPRHDENVHENYDEAAELISSTGNPLLEDSYLEMKVESILANNYFSETMSPGERPKNTDLENGSPRSPRTRVDAPWGQLKWRRGNEDASASTTSREVTSSASSTLTFKNEKEKDDAIYNIIHKYSKVKPSDDETIDRSAASLASTEYISVGHDYSKSTPSVGESKPGRSHDRTSAVHSVDTDDIPTEKIQALSSAAPAATIRKPSGAAGSQNTALASSVIRSSAAAGTSTATSTVTTSSTQGKTPGTSTHPSPIAMKQPLSSTSENNVLTTPVLSSQSNDDTKPNSLGISRNYKIPTSASNPNLSNLPATRNERTFSMDSTTSSVSLSSQVDSSNKSPLQRKSSFMHQSKFKNVFANAPRLESTFHNIRVSNISGDQNFIEANHLYIAVGIESAGGAFTILKMSAYRRFDGDTPLVMGHTAPVLDFSFNPFAHQVLASASEDCTIKLWQIPEEGLSKRLNTPLSSFNGHRKKVTGIRNHPSVANVLCSVSADGTSRLWDTETGQEIQNIRPSAPSAASFAGGGGGEVPIFDMIWNAVGSMYVLSTKDKNAYWVDPRSSRVVLRVDNVHDGTKCIKLAGLHDESDKIISCGNTKTSMRQVKIWDPRNVSTELFKMDVDNASGVLMPFFDPDTCLLYLAGKGDANIRYYEVHHGSDMSSIGEFKSSVATKGMSWVPKRGLDVMKCEIARLLKLTTSSIDPISFFVPRKATSYQADLYPDVWGDVPPHTLKQWQGGSNAMPERITLYDSEYDNTSTPRSRESSHPTPVFPAAYKGHPHSGLPPNTISPVTEWTRNKRQQQMAKVANQNSETQTQALREQLLAELQNANRRILYLESILKKAGLSLP